jgi:hypothetical protein
VWSVRRVPHSTGVGRRDITNSESRSALPRGYAFRARSEATARGGFYEFLSRRPFAAQQVVETTKLEALRPGLGAARVEDNSTVTG